MNILHLNFGKHFGGIEILVKSILLSSNHSKNNIFVGLRHGSEFEKGLFYQEETKQLVVSLIMRGPFNLIKSFFILIKFIKNKKIEIIHVHGIFANFVGVLLKIVFMGKVKLVATVHSSAKQDRVGFIKNKIFFYIEKLCLKNTDKIIAISQFIRKEVLNYGIDPNKVITIYNGVSDGIIRYKKNVVTPTFTIGVFGRLEKVKGHSYLFNALSMFKEHVSDFTCLVVGDGSERRELELLANRLTIDKNIRFLGYHSDIFKYLNEVDVVVLPSVMEGLSLSLIEALMFSKPAIASNIGGIPEVVEHMKTGYLTSVKNPEELFEAILLLYKDRNLLEKLSNNCYPSVKDKFSLKSMMLKLEKVYKNLL